MPRVNFDNVPDPEDYSPLPEGLYPCRIASIEEVETRNGDEMWKLTLAVLSGEYAGRKIFDQLVFSEKAFPRLKLVCSRFGVRVEGEVDLTPDMLEGREALVEVEIEEYETREGKVKRRNTVPFAGYEELERTQARSAPPAPRRRETPPAAAAGADRSRGSARRGTREGAADIPF